MPLHDRDTIREQFEGCVFADRDLTRPVAKYRFSQEGTLPRDAFQLVSDELMLDAPARRPRRRGAPRPPSGHRVDDQGGIRRVQPHVRPSALAGPLLANSQPLADPVRQFARLLRLVFRA